MTTRARIVIAALRAFVLLFGAAAGWFARDSMNPDGVAYLDASDVYLAGGWPAAGTGYWSPLYPTLLAVARRAAGTAAGREAVITQGVNLVVFVLAFLALEFLMHSARVATTLRTAADDGPNDFAWRVLAYALFAVVTVGWIRVGILTPDMCVTAIVLAIAAVCVNIANGGGGWLNFIALGVLLGLGYLAKAALFPVAIVTLVTLVFVLRGQRLWRRVVVATAVFLAISAPQIAYVSRLKGSPTFSDVGRLTYLWFIAGVPGAVSSAFPLPARLPSPSATGQALVALDPARGEHPAIYDIDAPIPGTLPIWYDAGYWFRGVTAPLLPFAIVRTFVRHVRVYVELFGFFLVGAVAAALTGSISRRQITATRPALVLVVPALAALMMYALLLVQARYVAPFTLLLFVGLVPPWATDELTRRVRIGLTTGALAAILFVVRDVRVDASYWRGTAQSRANVVGALASRGIVPGSRIGFIGEAYEAYWARPGRLRFVSLLPLAEAERFWALDASGRASVLAHMRDRGATAVIAELPALGVDITGWERLPSAGVPRPALIVYGGLR